MSMRADDLVSIDWLSAVGAFIVTCRRRCSTRERSTISDRWSMIDDRWSNDDGWSMMNDQHLPAGGVFFIFYTQAENRPSWVPRQPTSRWTKIMNVARQPAEAVLLNNTLPLLPTFFSIIPIAFRPSRAHCFGLVLVSVFICQFSWDESDFKPMFQFNRYLICIYLFIYLYVSTNRGSFTVATRGSYHPIQSICQSISI